MAARLGSTHLEDLGMEKEQTMWDQNPAVHKNVKKSRC